MSRTFIALCAAGLWLLLPNVARAQSRDTSGAKARPPNHGPATLAVVPACCIIVRLDSTRPIVTARETATGYTFRFEVKNRRMRARLKIGDPVWADFATKTVKLKATDTAPCCGIVETPPSIEGSTLGSSPRGPGRTGATHVQETP